jgi:WD40 repeat protein
MGADEAIALISYLLQAHDSNVRLSDLQLAVFRHCYSGDSYQRIADAYGYGVDYIKQIGSQLWQLLSQITGEKVSKSNLQAVLLRYQHERKVDISTFGGFPICDWGEAIDVSIFFERTAELQTLRRWIQTDRCRLITLLGMGGIGKTALSVKLAEELSECFSENKKYDHQRTKVNQKTAPETQNLESQSQIAAPFQFILWKSLRDAPTLEELLTRVIKFLSPQAAQLPDSIGSKLARFTECLQQQRCLIVLDNFDALFKAGQTGCYRAGYENYGELLRRIGEVRHQSCLVLTSREKPQEVIAAEGEVFAVRVLHLHGLQAKGGQALLQAKGLTSSVDLLQNLVDCYRGNPLALKIAATSILDSFTGNVTAFLQQKSYTFQGIEQLLKQHVERLSPLELQIMYWLAINREPVTVSELQTDLVTQISIVELAKTLESLRLRSLVEQTADGFTQQPVVMEYVTSRIIESMTQEISWLGSNPESQNDSDTVRTGCQPTKVPVIDLQISNSVFNQISFLQHYALIKATAKDYIRNSQFRMILQPTAQRAIEQLGSAQVLEERLFGLLTHWKTRSNPVLGYVAGNILNLFRHLQIDLTGVDFSHCQIRQAYLSDVSLNHVSFAHAEVSRCVFAETFGGILSVSFSPDGERLAIADSNGEIRIWDLATGQSMLVIKAHDAWVWSIAFSPDGRLLASASDDNTVKIWNPKTGQEIHMITAHTYSVLSVAFTPDGQYLASSSDDRTIRLWHVGETVCEHQTWHNTHNCRVWSLTFSPNGKTLASSSEDGTVKLWQVETGNCLQTLVGHSHWIRGIAFHPIENMIASGSHDSKIKLWDIQTGICLKTLVAHQDAVTSVAFSPDGQYLVSSSHDQTARVWHVESGNCVQVLQEHTNRIWSIAFVPHCSPHRQQVVTGGDDHAAKLWDLKTGRCIKTFQGYANSIAPIAITKDGKILASGHEDETVKLWNIQTGNVVKTLRGHADRVWSAVFAPAHVGEALLASGSGDQTIKIWNWQTGDCLKTLHGHQSWVWSLIFHPVDPVLVSSSYDGTIKLWDAVTGDCRETLTDHEASVTCVAISPNGEWLASCGVDQTIRIWNFRTRQCVHVWQEHRNTVWQVAFSPDGRSLVSCSYDQTVKIWDISKEICIKTLEGHTAPIVAVIWTPDGDYIFSSGFDQTIRQWNVETGECVQTLQGHHGLVSYLKFTDVLVSASFDETIRFWQPKTGQCLRVFRTPRPYEGLNLRSIKGLTEAQRSILIALGANEQEQPAVYFRQNRRLRSAVG